MGLKIVPAKPAGLFKRGATWYARFFVPAVQQQRLGKEDIAWSTKTGDLREARKRLPALQAKFEALISEPDPYRLALEEKYGIPATLPAAEALARLAAVTQAAQAADAALWAEQRAQAMEVDPESFGLDLTPEPELSADQVAKLRQEALYGHRAESSAFVAAAADAGLQAAKIAAVEDAAVALGKAAIPAAAGTALGMTALIDRWAAERKPKAKTLDEVRKSAALLTQALGIDKAPGDLTKQDFVDFKGWLLQQPGRDGKGYSSGTIIKRLNLIKTVLSYAEAELIIGSNPASKITVAKTKTIVRQPFSLGDLDLLFSPDTLPAQPTRRWLMLLGLYSGARLNELCQLQCPDLRCEDGIWYLSIDDLVDDEDGEQSIKNEGSRRNVPLHPAIIESGFLAFVGRRQGRVFADLEFDEMQGYGKAASKALNKHIRRLIPDRRKVFHSFRHTFKSLARNAGMPEDVHDFLTGHAGGHVGRDYGHGHGLKLALAEISKIEGRWCLPAR